MKFSNRSIQVLIPAYNESLHIENCVRSIFASAKLSKLKISVLLSDNNSTDFSKQIYQKLLREFSNLEIHEQVSNIGARLNWIYLLNMAKADYVFFIDAHDHLEMKYFQELEEALERDPYSMQIGHEIEEWQFEDSKFRKNPSGFYEFSNNPRLRILQAIFYLYHNTICHSVFRLENLKSRNFKSTRSYSFDHLITYCLLLDSNLRYLPTSKYIRRYDGQMSVNYTSKNSKGEFESRKQRVEGISGINHNDLNISSDFTNLTKNEFSLIFSKILKFLLVIKYSNNSIQKKFFRVLRFLFGQIPSFKAWKTYEG